MRSSIQLVTSTFLVVCVMGCSRESTATATQSDVATASPGTAIDHSSKLEAALAINSPIQKDEALRAVAQSASEGSDGPTALAAVAAMLNPQARDDVAAAAAMTLAKAGKGSDANGMANLIQNPIKRDETLLELSKL
jgi:hypothetical protein